MAARLLRRRRRGLRRRATASRPETFAAIAVKARRHAANNPYAVFRDPVTVEEVLASPAIYGPLTRLQCCPPTCGAAAAVVCQRGVRPARTACDADVAIAAQAMTTDTAVDLRAATCMQLVGYDMARRPPDRSTRRPGVGPEDIRVVELHDCFTTNELITYEALGLTPEGTAEKFILDGDNTYGGRVVTNPSGGLLSKGHPLGATGLAQCAELVVAAAWPGRRPAGRRASASRCSTTSASAAPPSSRCTRRSTLMGVDRGAIGADLPPLTSRGRARPAAGCSPRRSARRTRSTPMSTPPKRPGTADLPVPPTFLFGIELRGARPVRAT